MSSMNKIFNNKYRTTSYRLSNWDYSGNGYYFITIKTQKSRCCLGKIENGKMYLSNFGMIVQTEWGKSFEIRNELLLDIFVIMPNHIHGIVVSNKPNDGILETNDHKPVETRGRASLQGMGCIRKPKSLSSFITGFKSVVTTKTDDYIDEKK